MVFMPAAETQFEELKKLFPDPDSHVLETSKDAQPILTKIIKNKKTGERAGWDGTKYVPIGEISKHRNGARVTQSKEGKFYQLGPAEVTQDNSALEFAKRAAMNLVGQLNVNNAFFWGGQDAWDKGNYLGAPLSAIKSAKESAVNSESFGTTYGEYYQNVAGETIGETIDKAIGADTPGQSPSLHALKKTFSDVSEGTAEVLVDLATDIVTLNVFSVVRNLSKALKPFMSKGKVIPQNLSGLDDGTQKVVEELGSLVQNQNKLVGTLEAINKQKKLIDVRSNYNSKIGVALTEQQRVARSAQEPAGNILGMAQKGSVIDKVVPKPANSVIKIENSINNTKNMELTTLNIVMDNGSLFGGASVKDTAKRLTKKTGQNQTNMRKLMANVGPMDDLTMVVDDATVKHFKSAEALRKNADKANGKGQVEKAASFTEAAKKETAIGNKNTGIIYEDGDVTAVRMMNNRLKSAPMRTSADPLKAAITLEMTGLSKVGNMIESGINLGRKTYRRAKGFDVDPPSNQVEDILDLVEGMYKQQYGRQLYTVNPSKLIRDEARIQGKQLRKKKVDGKKRYVLSDSEGRKVFKNLDEVTQELGLGEKASTYKREVEEFYRDLAAEESKKDFADWAFPNGAANVTADDAWIAAQKLELVLKGKTPTHRLGDRIIFTQQALHRTPTGRAFSEKVLNARNESEAVFSKNFVDTQKIIEGNKIASNELDDVRLLLDGFNVDNPKALKTAKGIRPILDDVFKGARESGIDTAAKRENYFPHHTLSIDELAGGVKRKEVLQATVKEGLFPDTRAAGDVLDGYLARIKGNTSDVRFINWMARQQGISKTKALDIWNKTIAPRLNRVTGHLTKSRSRNIPWYDRNLNSALGHYYMEAAKGSVNMKAFGKNLDDGYAMIDKIRLEKGNWEMAQELLGRYTNPRAYPRPQGFARGLLTAQSIMKLNPLTTLVNYSQTLATALETTPKATLKAMFMGERDFSQRTGAIASAAMKDIMELHGGSTGVGAFYMRNIGFRTSEIHLRSLAANAGKFHAMDSFSLLQKGERVGYANRQLRKMGVDPQTALERGRLTDDELLRAGKRVSDMTQFRGDEFDLPFKWLGPEGRVITQFKTFVFNQGRLLKRTVVDETLAGNMRPLVFALTAYPLIGAGYDLLIDQIILGKEPPESLPGWYFEGIASVGGLGLLSNAWESSEYGKKAVLEAMGGPTVSDFATVASDAHDLLTGQKGSVDRAVRDVYGRSPFIGRLLKAHIDTRNLSTGARGARGAR